MFGLAILCGALACAENLAATPAAADAMRVYEEAKAKAGAGADAQVKLALWCEARGWTAQRVKHLALALVIDPKHAAARGLLGQLPFHGSWATPEQVSEKVKADTVLAAKRADYNARRTVVDEADAAQRLQVQKLEQRGAQDEARALRQRLDRKLASAHAQLGSWCEQNGLDAEATAHFTTAVVLDPYRDATWRHMGYIKHNGRWMTKDQIADAAREAQAQKSADKHWEPLLKKWRGWLSDKARRQEALDLLADVNDPRAVPSVERVFLGPKAADQQAALAILDRIDSAESTRDLAELGLKGASAEIRAGAARTLRGREKRDYAGILVELIHSPMRYQVQPVQGPGASGALLVETPRFKLLRTYDSPPAFELSQQFYGYVGYDANGMPVVVRGRELNRMQLESPQLQARDMAQIEARTAGLLAAAQLKAAAAQQRLMADITDIETSNAQTAVSNSQVRQLLTSALDAPDLSDDEDAWHVWWYDQLGYTYQAPAQVQLAQNPFPQSAGPTIRSCFVAGTPVRTIDGWQPIETLRVGDQVLCQHAESGALSFQSVLVLYRNAPSRTLRVALDNGETIVPSIYHRFWRAGLGWAQARELKSGDILRTLGGRVRVSAIEPGATEPVFNLDVASGHTFFVGRSGALVHDNTLPDAHLKPFDAEPPLATATAEQTVR